MIETRTFIGQITHPSRTAHPVVTLDEEVNGFLVKNRIRLLDIKFSFAASGDNIAGAAMIVYERDKYEGES